MSQLQMTAMITAVQGKENLLAKEINKCVKETLKEDGCIEFKVFKVSNDKRKFILWEIFEDQNALEYHMQCEHTKKYFNCGYIKSTEVTKLNSL